MIERLCDKWRTLLLFLREMFSEPPKVRKGSNCLQIVSGVESQAPRSQDTRDLLILNKPKKKVYLLRQEREEVKRIFPI